MKTNKFQLLLLALFFLVGCQKDEMASSVKKGSHSLVASIEKNDSISRTAVNENGGVTWVETDAIGVFGTQTKNAKFESTASGASVTFVGELESSHETPVVAYYPYDADASLDGNVLSFTLPSEYTYTGQSNAPMLGVKQNDGTFAFRHLCGLLKVTIKNMPENAKRLFVVSEGTEEKEAPAIVGDIIVNDVTADNATLNIAKNGGDEVSIDLKNVSAQETYTFYIPIPMGEYPKLSINLEIDNGIVGIKKSVSNVNMKRAMLLDMALVDIVDETISAKEVVVSVDMDNISGLNVSSFIDETLLDNNNNCSVDVITNSLPQFVFVSENENILMLSRGYFEDDNNVINAESTALALVTMQPAFVLGEKEHFDMLKNKVMQSSNFSLLKSEVEKEIKARKDIFLTENTNIPILINKIIEDVYGVSSVSRSLKGNIIPCLNNDPEPEPLTVRVDKDKVNIYNKDLYPAYECQVYHGGKLVIPSEVIEPTSNYYGILNLLDGENIHWGEPQEFSLSERGEYLFFCDMSTNEAILSTAASVVSDILSLITIGEVGKGIDNGSVWKNIYKYSTISWDKVQSKSDVLLKICSDLTFSIGPILLNREMNAKTMCSEILQVFGKYFAQELPTYLAKIEYRKYILGDNFLMLIEEKKWNGREFMARLFRFYNIVMSEINVIHRTLAYIECAQKMPFVEFKLCKYNEITCCTKFILDKKENTDNQIGLPYAKLKEPLMVGVKTEDGCDVKLDSYQKIKFEVVSGYGIVENQKNENKGAFVISSIDWKLGYSGEQKVKVVVYDEKLNMELSEPVYFTATFEPEEEVGTITTGEATNITETTATLSGNIQGYEADDFQHRYGIIYSTEATPTSSNGTIAYGANIQETGEYSVNIASLTENTTYYYRTFVIEGGNYVYGDVKNFTTQKNTENMSERDILIAFYKATDGDNWTNGMNKNWCSDLPLNEWAGVQTNEEGKIVKLFLGIGGYTGKADLRGLEYIEEIRLDGSGYNALTFLNVSNLKTLKYLDCSGNKLTSINLTGLEALEYLHLEDNVLEHIDLSDNEKLRILDISNNLLSDLDLKNNSKLEILTCHKNKLTALDVSHLLSLSSLDCDGNMIEYLNLSNQTKLKYFCYRKGNLRELKLPKAPLLDHIIIPNNQVEKIQLLDMSSLNYLDCSSNKIVELDLSQAPKLKTLYCQKNSLTSLDLSYCPLLEFVFASDCLLSNLNCKGLNNLEGLHVSGNQLELIDVSDCVVLDGFSYLCTNYIKHIILPINFTLFKTGVYGKGWGEWDTEKYKEPEHYKGYQYPTYSYK